MTTAKSIIYTTLITLFTLSCTSREASSLREELKYLKKERDSLELMLHITRDYFYNKHHIEKDTLCYYISGHDRELLARGIIKRATGLSKDYLQGNSFVKTDFHCHSKGKLDTIVIKGRIPRVVGNFDPEHYEIVNTRKKDRYLFIIKDKARFWRYSSFLIISYK